MSEWAQWLLCFFAFLTVIGLSQCVESLRVIRAQLGEILGHARQAEQDGGSIVRLLLEIAKNSRQ